MYMGPINIYIRVVTLGKEREKENNNIHSFVYFCYEKKVVLIILHISIRGSEFLCPSPTILSY